MPPIARRPLCLVTGHRAHHCACDLTEPHVLDKMPALVPQIDIAGQPQWTFHLASDIDGHVETLAAEFRDFSLVLLGSFVGDAHMVKPHLKARAVAECVTVEL